ncbi:hypothetical protein AVEN_104306-1 [Araneus ventricosus]|uniref:Uncharacterized protein n=1 Tax=Araneus ventricosus TaxID=182803 RepID=A0A4Y2BUW4_ARAVE|nr:hypothetical protein AVEN_104306-1 [Araneus ventricosus]
MDRIPFKKNIVKICKEWPSSKVSESGPDPGPKPDSTEDPPSMRTCCTLNHSRRLNFLSLKWCGGLGRRMQELKCRPRRLTAIQNYEVNPKIAFVLLQNGTLI